MALSEFIGARVVNAEEYEEQQQRLSALPSAATLTRCIEVQTDDLREHKLMELMRQVIESGSYQGALLRNDTYTYCLIHTQLRQILIAAVKGAGLGRLWSTREAQAMLTLTDNHNSPEKGSLLAKATVRVPGILGLKGRPAPRRHQPTD